MKRVAMVCGALGSMLVVFGCSSSDGAHSGSGGATAMSQAGSPGTNTGGAVGMNTGGAAGMNTAGAVGMSLAGSTGMTTGGSFVSSVSGSKVLSSLTDAEIQTWCADISKSDALKPVTDFSCRVAGLLAALFTQTDPDAQAACQSAYTSCVTDPTSSQCSHKPSASCQATVAEYDACLNDEVAVVKTLAAQIPMCSTLTQAALQMGGDPGDQTPPASCQIISEKCPEVAAGMN